jgi:hypothetical protein
MKLLLTGEGKTDIGYKALGKEGWIFQPGPMAWIIDRLLESHQHIGYSLLKVHAQGGDCVQFLDESELASHGKSGPT